MLSLGIRVYDKVEQDPPQIGEKILLEIQVYNGRVSARRAYRRFYARLGELENGNYRGNFKILEKRGSFYHLEILSIQKKRENFCQRYMQSCVKELGRGRDPSFGHFLEAILLGKSVTLFREEKALFRYLGLSHLLAMSGLHVSLLFFVLNKILLLLKIPKRTRNYSLIVCSSFYFLGVFRSPSFFRAYIMGICYLIASLFGEKISKTKILFLSIWIILMKDPNELTSLSFQLSYLAVVTIFFIVPLWEDIFKEFPLLSYVAFTLSIQLVTTPLLMASFGLLPFLSFFINLLCVPFATGLILLSFFSVFLEVFHLGFLLAFLLERYYQIFYQILEILGKLPYLTIALEEKISYEGVIFFYIFLFLCVVKYKTCIK